MRSNQSSRRQFIQFTGISFALTVLGNFGLKALAQTPRQIHRQIPADTNRVRPIQATRSLLNDIQRFDSRNPEQISILTEATTDKELELGFENLNDLFTFDRNSGELKINPNIVLDADEERVAQQIINGFKQRVQNNDIQLHHDTQGLFIPLTAEPETRHQIPVRAILSDKPIVVSRPCWRSNRYWWGVRIGINKDLVDLIVSSREKAEEMLVVAFRIPRWIAAIIARSIQLIAKLANQHGIRIYITWTGVSWVRRSSSAIC